MSVNEKYDTAKNKEDDKRILILIFLKNINANGIIATNTIADFFDKIPSSRNRRIRIAFLKFGFL